MSQRLISRRGAAGGIALAGAALLGRDWWIDTSQQAMPAPRRTHTGVMLALSAQDVEDIVRVCYFEARSESGAGVEMVAAVMLNRCAIVAARRGGWRNFAAPHRPGRSLVTRVLEHGNGWAFTALRDFGDGTLATLRQQPIRYPQDMHKCRSAVLRLLAAKQQTADGHSTYDPSNGAVYYLNRQRLARSQDFASGIQQYITRQPDYATLQYGKRWLRWARRLGVRTPNIRGAVNHTFLNAWRDPRQTDGRVSVFNSIPVFSVTLPPDVLRRRGAALEAPALPARRALLQLPTRAL